jgi:hypothetical protein
MSMKQKGLLTTLILIFFSIYIVMGQDKFIEPCPDAGGYYSWLGGPRGNHLGHDYNAPPGTRVKAIADGTVYKVFDISQSHCYDPNTKREVKQTFVWIKHRLSNGQYFYALYGHIKPLGKIRDNANVKIGEEIGEIVQCYVYNEKKVLVPAHHLHFGIWNSESPPPLNAVGYGPVRSFTNPKKFLQENKPYASLKTEDLSLKIIGKWVTKNYDKFLELKEDNTYVYGFSGRWAIHPKVYTVSCFPKDPCEVLTPCDPDHDALARKIFLSHGNKDKLYYEAYGQVHAEKGVEEGYIDIEGKIITNISIFGKVKGAKIITNVTGMLWSKYVNCKGNFLEFNEDGSYIRSWETGKWEIDGKFIKLYSSGDENNWWDEYEIKDNMLRSLHHSNHIFMKEK